MSNTLTIRFPDPLLEQLREKSKVSGVPVGQVVREFVEKGLSQELPANGNQVWRKYSGIFNDGPPDLSSRKGYSRK